METGETKTRELSVENTHVQAYRWCQTETSYLLILTLCYLIMQLQCHAKVSKVAYFGLVDLLL